MTDRTIDNFLTGYILTVPVAAALLLFLSLSTIAQAPAAPAKTFTFTKLEVIDKPPPGYTELARDNKIQGTVKLLVTFKANGQIGEITVVEPLTHGLTERAVEAAKRIRFRPKAMNGEPMDEQTTVEYNFNLYYDDADGNSVRTRVALISAPKPELTTQELPASLGGKIDVRVFFSSGGSASVFEMPSELSREARIKIENAVKKIRFRPAVHKNGSRISVIRVVSYAL